jgi:cytidylate kinase
LSDQLIITLDGPSGSGKSTASLKLAEYFKIPCLDTGAMYRTIALKSLERKIPADDETKLKALAETFDFNFGVEDSKHFGEYKEGSANWTRIGNEIRTLEVSMAASTIAKLKTVREVLVQKQQEIGVKKGAVVEGRDAGTVIFPKAPYKFFLTASLEARAKRRFLELKEKLGPKAETMEQVIEEVRKRDDQDEKRAHSPTKPAEGAIILDTSAMELPDVVAFLIREVEARQSK